MSDDRTPAMRAVEELTNSGGWFHVPGLPNAVAYMRPWDDGSTDMIAMQSETHAVAERTNRIGQPVWRSKGAVTDVIAALDHLPPPFAPNAPRDTLKSPNTDRDMGTP